MLEKHIETVKVWLLAGGGWTCIASSKVIVQPILEVVAIVLACLASGAGLLVAVRTNELRRREIAVKNLEIEAKQLEIAARSYDLRMATAEICQACHEPPDKCPVTNGKPPATCVRYHREKIHAVVVRDQTHDSLVIADEKARQALEAAFTASKDALTASEAASRASIAASEASEHARVASERVKEVAAQIRNGLHEEEQNLAARIVNPEDKPNKES
jgi:hypothetical protein